MSDTLALAKKTQQPQTIYLKDYEVPAFLIDEIELAFDLQDNETIVSSHMRMRHNRQSKCTKRTLTLNGEELTLVSIKMDGKELGRDQYLLQNDFLIINDLPDMFTLEIVNKICPEKNTKLSGLYRSGNTYCTQCEAEGFRRITYFMDRPDVLSRYTTKITADAKRYPMLLSNGNLLESGALANGRHWVKWEDPFKKPCYLFALVAGDFDLIEDKFVTQSKREVALKVYVEKGYADQTAHAIYSMHQAMRWDEVAYGREYDLDIYMIVAIGDFNMGAMENKGLNIFNTQYVLAKPETATDDDYIHISSVIAHEYFHNWSGNRVTCRDWFQLSLKEGLTIFRDQSFSEDTISHAVMRIREVKRLREAQFPEDAGPLAHPVRPDSYMEINNFYTATIYEKGSEVLRMLQTILGKALFRKGMDLYFSQHDGEAVTINDFVASMEDVSGVDLEQFRLWYSQAGTPIVAVESQYDSENKTYTLTLAQMTSATPGQANKVALDIPIRMGLLDSSGKQIPLCLEGMASKEVETVLHLRSAKQTFQFTDVPTAPIPSLLRNFSAPVKLQMNYTDQELIFLAKYDVDAFNRWEAVQQYTLRVMLALIKQCEQKQILQLPEEFVKLYEYLLTNKMDDKLLQAEMLVLPSEKMIGEQMLVVAVDAIHTARELVLLALAKRLEKAWLITYEQNKTTNTKEFSLEMVGKRQLKNICLAYLILLPAHVELGYQQFQAAMKVNMTDTLAALINLANTESPLGAQALEQFYQAWRNDALVVDKWLAIQATSKRPDALVRIKQLLQHEAFDMKNPNKVYALIGAFGQRNIFHFHAVDGSGYQFLREFVQKLDKLNPQVAARMVNPLTSWKRYDKQRQQLMCNELQQFAQDAQLSTNLYELVNKSLSND